MTKMRRIIGMLLCCTFLLTCFCDTLTVADDMRQVQCTHRHTEECYTQLIQCVLDTDTTETVTESDADTISDNSERESEAKSDHICSEESGCITKILQCTHVHDETCGYPIASKELSVVSWEWVDDEELLVFDEHSGKWGLGLPGASRENVLTAELLSELLPREIRAKLTDGAEESIPVEWELADFPEDGLYEGQHTLSAVPGEGYVLDKDAPKLEVLLDLGGASVMATTVTPEQKEAHTVTDRVVEPPNTTVNLFNYGVTGGVSPENKRDVLDADSSTSKTPHWRDTTQALGSAWGISSPIRLMEYAQYNYGINKNHLIIFGNAVTAHNGLWNRGSGANNPYGQVFVNTDGMVNRVLAEDGYPTISAENAFKTLDCAPGAPLDPSLNYDPTKQAPGKIFYTNPFNLNTGWFYKWELIGDWKSYGDDHSIHMTQQQVNLSAADKNKINPYSKISKDVRNLSQTLINSWQNATGKTFGTGAGQSTESLAYLFDPTVPVTDNGTEFKKSYTDVKGFYQIDNDGYYYYDMRKNFAEFVEGKNGESNKFVLYDTPATINSIDNTVGNFLPFNTFEEVFHNVDPDAKGNLIRKGSGRDGYIKKMSGDGVAKDKTTLDWYTPKSDAAGIDHYFGLTTQTEFRQPINGMVNNSRNELVPMTFEFSGDDDVWIFVDDVLVLDLGGVHSEIYGTIDFSSGKVYTGRSFKFEDAGNGKKSAVTVGFPPAGPDSPDQMVKQTTLKQIFADAGRVDSTQWKGDTFASNTDHTIKLFYLERGNYDSSLTLRFNLLPRLYQKIKKVDQDGAPLAGVEFELYAAGQTTDADGNVMCTNEAMGGALTTLTTGADGIAEFYEGESASTHEEQPFNFSDRAAQGQIYYILRESRTPEGYRTLPTDIILKFDSENTMLVVDNRYQSGSYSSFTSTVIGNNNIYYGEFNGSTGDISSTENRLVHDIQRDGLVVAIPMLLEDTSQKWKALYGSNVTGFKSVTPENRTPEDWRTACLTAMLRQCSDTNPNVPHWYLSWNTETQRLEGTLSDLPGAANRYRLNNASGDMKMVYAIITPDALGRLGIDYPKLNDEQVYAAIGAKINELVSSTMTYEQAITEVRETILAGNGGGRGFFSLNTDQFNRSFRSLVYIPNERRELRVWKVDQTGQPVNGVEFAIYADQSCSGTPLATGVTDTVDGRDGVLVFTPSPKLDDSGSIASGYSQMIWASHENAAYYLKETKAPPDFELNKTVIPIKVGVYSIYADAGADDDGITVMTEVGKLSQTMKKYAADEEVNITLRDITVTAQTQPSGKFAVDGWQEMKLEGSDEVRSLNLHYGQNALIDYGIHDEDGGKSLYPYFVTDSGFITVRVKQNGSALKEDGPYQDAKNNANYDDLGDMDITGLFSLVNIVVVTDTDTTKSNYGELTVSKRIEGPAELIRNDYNRNFEFKLELTDKDGKPVDTESQFYFYGKDKSGYIRNGDTFFLHHDETFTILGLPIGTRYTVTEMTDETGGYICALGPVRTGTVGEAQGADTSSGQRAYFVNVRNSIKFAFTKVDAYNPEKVLPGAAFSLYKWVGEGEADKNTLVPTDGTVDLNWQFILSTESDADGRVYFDKYLSTGTYRLVETKAPTGYLRPKSQWQFEVIIGESTMQIDEKSFTYVGERSDKPPAFLVGEGSVQDGVTVFELRLPNMPAADLPFTGGRSKQMFMLLGAGLICTASCIAIWYCANGGRKRHGVKKC